MFDIKRIHVFHSRQRFLPKKEYKFQKNNPDND